MAFSTLVVDKSALNDAVRRHKAMSHYPRKNWLRDHIREVIGKSIDRERKKEAKKAKAAAAAATVPPKSLATNLPQAQSKAKSIESLSSESRSQPKDKPSKPTLQPVPRSIVKRKHAATMQEPDSVDTAAALSQSLHPSTTDSALKTLSTAEEILASPVAFGKSTVVAAVEGTEPPKKKLKTWAQVAAASPADEAPPRVVKKVQTSTASKGPSKLPQGSPHGLTNPGFFCYRRSVLQTLLHLPPVIELVRKHRLTCKKTRPCLGCALGALSNSYWHQPANIEKSLRAFDGVVKAIGPRGRPRWVDVSQYKQADAHEFLCWILQVLEEQCNVPRGEFSRMFHLQHETSWTCRRCKAASTIVQQPEVGLPLKIVKPRPGLLLSKYVEAHHTEAVEGLRCDVCKSVENRTRTFTIVAAPEVLVVQLARFQRSAYGAVSKVASPVELPERLDLRPFCRASAGGTARYELAAVVSHSGTLSSGHYDVVVRASGGGFARISDESVARVGIGQLLGRQRGFTPYILTYVRLPAA
ncbi:hypothetical protein BJ546DRAFT_138921 [Cryomyces antarcticus]